MAWLEQHPTSGHFKICFRWNGRKIKKTVKTGDRTKAQSALARFNENLGLLECGRLELPPGGDIGAFLLSDGKLGGAPVDARSPKDMKLGELRDLYLAVHSNGAMEANSLNTVRIHLRHVIATLGVSFRVKSLNLADLQRHVDRRARKQYRGRLLSSVTLRKELATFRACWNWARHAGTLDGEFPANGLKFPKTSEKPPFQTRADIERQIGRGGLSGIEIRHLWECLFLPRPEIDEFLKCLRNHPDPPFLYPMVCVAAHTGARRSELLRIKIDDVDFASGTILLHEKKRVRGRRTNRRVPMSAFLQAILRDWLAQHPGGQHLFEVTGIVGMDAGRKASSGITVKEAYNHFRLAVVRSQWAVVRGWHVLRHSFASNCAAAGLDQRLINEWMGHQTEEMVRRYRHLFPDQQRQAIAAVFG